MAAMAHERAGDVVESGSRAMGYAPVPAQQDDGASAQRRRPIRAAAAAATAGLLLAAGAVAVRSHGGISGLLYWSGASPTFLEAKGSAEVHKRSCVLLSSIRLDNGAGVASSAKADTPEECAEKCQEHKQCGQLIFSQTNKGCYMFEKPTTDLYPKSTGNLSWFDSAYCGPEEDSLSRQALRHQVLDTMAQKDILHVRKQWADAEERARKLVDTMTLQDKMSLVTGSPGGLGYAGFLKPQGLPQDVMPLKMQDGPQGFNPYQKVLAGTATQFPALVAVAASFNPEIAKAYAAAVADEFVTKGANVLLGPDVEVTRTVLSGRCFETISGEDPFLGSKLVAPFVKAVQARGIIATVKHWLDNNQEIYRQTMTAIVGERAQHEIYMPVFKAAFEAGAGAVMCSYNKVNGHHACENEHLLKKLLREDLGFKGYVVSDWGATHNATASANNGLDVEMPTDKYFKELPELIQNGTVKQEQLDEKASHVLSSMYFVGQFEGRFPLSKSGALGHLPATTDGHRAVALKTIVESAVLLKNHGATLPFKTAGKKIALIGKYCNHSNDKSFSQGSVYSGGGSGFVMTTRTVTPLQGMHDNIKDASSIEWSSDVAAAKGADLAVICAAAHAEEGWDRKNLSLPEAEDLTKKLRKLPGGEDLKIVVLAAVPGAVTTEWIDGVDAALMLFGPGEQVGNALAKLITGEASPSGRLPVSLPKVGEERFTKWQYPGLCKDNSWCEKMIANFSEDVLVGYRWNDAKGEPSAFPFGFGLSYTDFEFKNLKVKCDGTVATIAFQVANVGERDGVAVPQLYVGFDSLKPVVRQLRGFDKLSIPSGSTADIIFVLREADWSFYDAGAQKWVSAVKKGEDITFSVGSSSVHLPLTSKISCNAKAVVRRKE